MKKIAVVMLLGMVLGLTSSSPAQEQIFFAGQELGVGARAMAMGGAYVGVADDYSAMYWNPAGLAQMRRSELNIGFSHNAMENTATFLGQEFDSKDTFTRLNSVGLSFPIPTYRGSLVLGIGYNKVRDYNNTLEFEGFNTRYAAFQDWVAPTYIDDDTGLPFTTTIDDSVYQKESLYEDGSLNEFVLSGAIEVQKNFFLGATVAFLGGKDEYNLLFDEADIYNLYNTPLYETPTIISDLDYWLYDQTITSEFSGTRLRLGGLYKLGNIRLGATMTAPTEIRVKESWSEVQKEYYDQEFYDDEAYEELTDSGEFEYKYREPYAFSFGGSIQLINVLLSGAVDFQDWSQAEFTTEPPVGGTKGEINNVLRRELQAVTKIRLGAEVTIPIIDARVRAGYFNSPSPYKYATMVPDKEYLSAGFGLMLGRQAMFDLSLVHGSWQLETVDDLTQVTTIEDKTFDKLVGTLKIRF